MPTWRTPYERYRGSCAGGACGIRRRRERVLADVSGGPEQELLRADRLSPQAILPEEGAAADQLPIATRRAQHGHMVYKQNGYCFKTEAAKKDYGSEGCRYDNEADVPLNGFERHNIALIKRVEQEQGCR